MAGDRTEAYDVLGDKNENQKRKKRKADIMLWTIVLILAVLWLLGLVTSTTMGGLIHVLLVVAVIMVLVNLLSGRRRA